MTISFVDTNKLVKDAKLKTFEIPLDLRAEINSTVDWPALLSVHYRAGSGRLKHKEPSLHRAARRGAVDPRLQSDWRTGAEETPPEQPTTRLLSEPDTDSISASFSNAVWQEEKQREWIIILVQLAKPKEFVSDVCPCNIHCHILGSCGGCQGVAMLTCGCLLASLWYSHL